MNPLTKDEALKQAGRVLRRIGINDFGPWTQNHKETYWFVSYTRDGDQVVVVGMTDGNGVLTGEWRLLFFKKQDAFDQNETIQKMPALRDAPITDEATARKVLVQEQKAFIGKDDKLTCFSGNYIAWDPDSDDVRVTLDGHFSVRDLNAIIWWMQHKGKTQ
jgi:hypothetical protein